jgi:hypothetical protein
VPPRRGCRDGLEDDDPLFLVKRLVAFFHMVAALSHTNIYPGFSTGNKVHKYYLEYGLWVELGCFLLDETNLEWKAKSKVVLKYKLENTNKELSKWLTWGKGSTRVLIKGVGRPAWTDRPGALSAPPRSVLL